MEFSNIVEDEQESKPVGDIVCVVELRSEYLEASSPGYLPGIDYLSSKYRIRRIVGDGNCFYRAFLFGYLDKLLALYAASDETQKAVDEKERMLKRIDESKAELVDVGYSEIAIESFHDMLIELVSNLFSMSSEELLSAFQSGGSAEYYTWYMRCLTAGYMRKNATRFLPFVLSDGDGDVYLGGTAEDAVALFCTREVEPMGREVEQLMVAALCASLGVQTRLEYLDGRPFEGSLKQVCVLEDEDAALVSCPFEVVLLYRPGHYDILYPL